MTSTAEDEVGSLAPEIRRRHWICALSITSSAEALHL